MRVTMDCFRRSSSPEWFSFHAFSSDFIRSISLFSVNEWRLCQTFICALIEIKVAADKIRIIIKAQTFSIDKLISSFWRFEPYVMWITLNNVFIVWYSNVHTHKSTRHSWTYRWTLKMFDSFSCHTSNKKNFSIYRIWLRSKFQRRLFHSWFHFIAM